MPQIEGQYATSGVWGGTYYGWETRWIPITIKLDQDGVTTALKTPACTDPQPIHKVEIEDLNEDPVTVTEITGVPSYGVNRSVDNRMDTASVMIADAEAHNPFGTGALAGLIVAEPLTKRVRISSGYKVGGIEYLWRIFTGAPIEADPTWPAKGGSTVKLTLRDLMEVLARADGVKENFAGSRAYLILSILEDLDLPGAILAFDDEMIAAGDGVSFIQATAMATIAEVMKLYPELFWRMNEWGVFEAVPLEGSLDVLPMTYGDQNLDDIGRPQNVSEVVTEVAVAGKTAAASLTVPGSGVDKAKYGLVRASLSSEVIKTAAEATAAAAQHITRSKRGMRGVRLRALFNPGVRLGTVVPVNEAVRGSEISGNVSVRTQSLSVQGGRALKMAVSGQLEES